jgi:hypothetical protein
VVGVEQVRNVYIILMKNCVGKEATGKVHRARWRALLLVALCCHGLN